MAKAYNLTFDYILYKMSFANVRLYNAVLPSLMIPIIRMQ